MQSIGLGSDEFGYRTQLNTVRWIGSSWVWFVPLSSTGSEIKLTQSLASIYRLISIEFNFWMFIWLCRAFSCPHVLVYPIIFPKFWSRSFSSITWQFMQRKRMFAANVAKALVCQMHAAAMSLNVDSCLLVLVGVLIPQWKHSLLTHGDKCTNCQNVMKQRKKGK